jgi:hypothetical protein
MAIDARLATHAALRACCRFRNGRTSAMKMIVTVLGLALVALAVMYFTMPADQLPAFLPGHEAGVARVHMKHGAVAAAAGLALLAVTWMLNRRAAA